MWTSRYIASSEPPVEYMMANSSLTTLSSVLITMDNSTITDKPDMSITGANTTYVYNDTSAPTNHHADADHNFTSNFPINIFHNLTSSTLGPFTNATTMLSTTTMSTTHLVTRLLPTTTTTEPELIVPPESGVTPTPPLDEKDLSPLGLLTILIVTVLGNLAVCLVVKLDRRLHHMTYYFFVSMAVVHLLMAALVMPPAVLVMLAGKLN